MHINLINHDTGMTKENVKVGYSWTMLFFSVFVPLFRGDWKWTIIVLLTGTCTLGLFTFILTFLYNRLYINDLLSHGYVPASEFDRQVLIKRHFITKAF